MDTHSCQNDSFNRKDHPVELIQRNLAAASSIIPRLALRHTSKMIVCRGNIVDMDVDAVVNAANETLLGGGGVDEAIHKVSGPQLKQYCQSLPATKEGVRCATGDAVTTPGFNLKAKWVIHTVAPYLDEFGQPQPKLLRKCYQSCMEQAWERKMSSVAFCCLGTGFYGFPMLEASIVALETCDEFLSHHPEWNVKVMFVVFNDMEESIYKKLI